MFPKKLRVKELAHGRPASTAGNGKAWAESAPPPNTKNAPRQRPGGLGSSHPAYCHIEQPEQT